MDKTALWENAAAFHGHVCPGLTIGYRAALYAIDLLELKLGGGGNAGCLSKDEEIVCISENDACGCDAIQVIMGCSIGKGNLLFHMTGKQAFSFYNRKTGMYTKQELRDMGFGFDLNGNISRYQEIEERCKKYIEYRKNKWADEVVKWMGEQEYQEYSGGPFVKMIPDFVVEWFKKNWKKN